MYTSGTMFKRDGTKRAVPEAQSKRGRAGAAQLTERELCGLRVAQRRAGACLASALSDVDHARQLLQPVEEQVAWAAANLLSRRVERGALSATLWCGSCGVDLALLDRSWAQSRNNLAALWCRSRLA